MVGKVESYILDRISKEGAIHMTLIDPDKTDPKEAARIAKDAESAGTSAIMVGGSLGVSEAMTDELIREVKKCVKIPIILFPGSVSGVSKYADAIWFLSVLNSKNTYYLIGAQVQGAVIVKKYGLESIPLAYLILGDGGAVALVSEATPLPFSRPDLIAAYALAAEMLGFRFVYLEGGSGGLPVPPKVIMYVRKTISIPIVVGGGIKNYELARKATMAGADIIVTGTIVEETEDVKSAISNIVKGIKDGATMRASIKDYSKS